MKNKRGISLLVLLITIIIICILAGTVILNLGQNNPIDSAKKSKFLQTINTYSNELQIWISNEYLEKLGNLDTLDINASKKTGTYSKDGVTLKIKDIIKTIKLEDENKFIISRGILKYIGDDQKEKQWCNCIASKEDRLAIYPKGAERVNPIEAGYTVDTASNTITSYTGTSKNIIIPKSFLIDGVEYEVLNIGNNVFANKGLIELYIPSNIKSIGDNAFQNNPFTLGVTLDANLTFAAQYANSIFSDCTIGDRLTITDNVTTLPDYIFAYAGLTSITIPSSVKSIGSYACFRNAITEFEIPSYIASVPDGFLFGNKLTKLIIPSTVTSVGSFAFAYNPLTEGVILDSNITTVEDDSIFYGSTIGDRLTITNNVTTLPDYIFSNAGLTSITIPSTVKSIGKGVCYSNLITEFEIPSYMTTVPQGFLSSNKLTNLTIPNTVTSIGSESFRGNKLTSITIPNSVTTIGSVAFGENSLTSITIPSSVTSIGSSAFYHNKILQGTAIIQNTEGNVAIEEIAFEFNGTDGSTTITPVYQP